MGLDHDESRRRRDTTTAFTADRWTSRPRPTVGQLIAAAELVNPALPAFIRLAEASGAGGASCVRFVGGTSSPV